MSHTSTKTTQPVVAIERFGKFNRLLRVTAWVLHFVRNCRRNEPKREGALSAKEVQEVRLLLLCQVQKKAFGKALNHLERSARLSGSVEL